MRAWYNDTDPYVGQWLRNLIAAGHIAPGDVDERSIEEVNPDDLRDYTQCHFFAGIGTWSYALRKAGWPDDKPVWTGSCPCQPFSTAGKGKGFADERHLWPALFHLIQQCKPGVIFGEQVAGKDGLAWLDLVHTDLEAENYATAALDLCAAGFGAPHIRQRLYWMAHAHHAGREGWQGMPECAAQCPAGARSVADGLANAERQQHKKCLSGLEEDFGPKTSGETVKFTGRCLSDGMDTNDTACPTNGFWQEADWLFWRDGKWRPVKPGTRPLADGITNRVGRLRAYGNTLNAPQAQHFIAACMHALTLNTPKTIPLPDVIITPFEQEVTS